ncbi:MAG: hypothetical protein ABI758_05980, partial [Candidatus Woesebacteria bacterium]
KDFKVAYIVDENDKFITLIEVDPKGLFDGVAVFRTDDVCSFRVHSLYINKLGKKILGDTIYTQGMNIIERVKEFSFKGFARALQNSKTLVEVDFINGNGITGRILGYEGEKLAVDEFDQHEAVSTGRSFSDFAGISGFVVDAQYMRKIVKSLTEKNI